MALIAIRKNFVNRDEKPRFSKMRVEQAMFMWRPNMRGLYDVNHSFNRDHKRTFTIVLEGLNKERAMEENWAVQHADAIVTEDGRELPERYYVEIEARYDNFPPKIIVTENGVAKAVYKEENECSKLFERIDTERLANVDLVISPSVYWSEKYQCWRTGAYLDQMFIEFKEDDISFGGKYMFENADYMNEDEELPFH